MTVAYAPRTSDVLSLTLGMLVFLVAFFVLDYVIHPDRCYDGTLVDQDQPRACSERGGFDPLPSWIVLLSSAAMGGAVAGAIRLWRLADTITVFAATPGTDG